MLWLLLSKTAIRAARSRGGVGVEAVARPAMRAGRGSERESCAGIVAGVGGECVQVTALTGVAHGPPSSTMDRDETTKKDYLPLLYILQRALGDGR